MADKSIKLQGRNLDRLVLEAERLLDSPRDNIEIKILKEKKTIFGMSYEIEANIKDEQSLRNIEMIVENIEANTELSTKNDENQDGDNEDKKARDHIDIDEEEIEEIIDCTYEVYVSKDGMEAYITAIPPNRGKEIDKDDIREILESNNIEYGVIDSAIESMAKNKIYNSRTLIAQGTPPIDGIDAYLEYHFDTSRERKINILEDGKADFKELSLIKNVNEEQLLVTMIPATEGSLGKSVYGEEIQARDGKPIRLPVGKNVKVDDDGLNLFAAIDGEVKFSDGKVSVYPVYEVPANVDNTTGNIKFLGKVIVKGNVLTNFTIEADDDVEVFGVVEGAKIFSKGNITLHRGMQGMNRGELHCEGDLIAKFIENSKIHAKGSIKTEAIMHSTVFSGKKLDVGGRKGLIVGGQIKAAEEIKAKIIGSPMATITEVEVGTNPEVRSKYEKSKIEKDNISENLIKLNQAINVLTKLNRENKLSEERKELLNKSIIMKLKMQSKFEQIRSEIKSLELHIEEMAAGKIKAEQIVYPGTRIIIGSSMMYIKDKIQYATFYRYEGEVKIGSFES